MSNNSLSFEFASGADSTQVQEQVVKSCSSSSSNLNNASKRVKAELALSLPSGSIKGVANEVEVCEAELDLADFKFDYRTGNPAVYVSSYHRYSCGNLD